METAYHLRCGGVQVWRLAPPHSEITCRKLSKFNVLTIYVVLGIIVLEHLFDYATRGHGIMIHSEMEVINKIRNSKDPERALQIATEIILDHLKKKESSQSQSSFLPQEFCEAI